MRNSLYSKMFLWMFLGLLITFVTGYYVSTNVNMLYNIFSTNLYWFIFLAEIITVIVLSARLMKMSKGGAIFAFLFYSLISGLTFASVFVLFEMPSIMYMFLVTAVVFAIFAFIGSVTKMDLSKLSTILFMGLLAILLCGVINLFILSDTFDFIINVIAIVIFLAYIAYDIQKIKRLDGIVPEDNLAIIGALELYLDFINLFIHLIQIFGKSNN